jgi:hypothetical protein
MKLNSATHMFRISVPALKLCSPARALEVCACFHERTNCDARFESGTLKEKERPKEMEGLTVVFYSSRLEEAGK